METTIVTRIPPSPTGLLHIGTARTALYNFLFARKHKGKVVLRMEDTDLERNKREYEDNIIEGLTWLSLSWDEFYRQTERASEHTKLLEKLVNRDRAYVSTEPSKADPNITVDVIRLRNPNARITFHDELRGDISFDTTELGDFVIAKSMREPLYHFAVVADDNYSNVTHVIRGEDHISNTPRQILIQEALDFKRPIYAHLPLILAPDRSKLSKRKGSVAVSEYRDQGFLPEAIINYLALLGWNPGTNQEMFSMKELVGSFSLDGIQKAGAIFDIEKLKWINREYIKDLSLGEKKKRLNQKTLEVFTYNDTAITEALERVSTFGELDDLAEQGEFDFYIKTPENITAGLLVWKKSPNPDLAAQHLLALKTRLENLHEDVFTRDQIKSTIWEYAEKEGRGEVLWPMRTALSGREASPDPFLIAEVIGKSETLKRFSHAYEVLQKTLDG